MKKIQRFLRGTALLPCCRCWFRPRHLPRRFRTSKHLIFTSTITLVCFRVILRVIL